MHIKCRVRPEKATGVSASRLWANREVKSSTGSGSTLLLCESHGCWYSYWWKKNKISQSHLKFNHNVFVENGRKQGSKHFRLQSLLKHFVLFSCCFLGRIHYDPLILSFFLALLDPLLCYVFWSCTSCTWNVSTQCSRHLRDPSLGNWPRGRKVAGLSQQTSWENSQRSCSVGICWKMWPHQAAIRRNWV